MTPNRLFVGVKRCQLLFTSVSHTESLLFRNLKSNSLESFSRHESLIPSPSAEVDGSRIEENEKEPTPEVTELEVPVPWGRIAGKIWGSPEENGLPVLGLHGWKDNAGTYDKLVPLLNSRYLVALDLPGHGQSSHLAPGDVYGYVDFVFAVRRVIRYLKWPKFNIVGHSMGAGIGALYSCVFPSEVNSLVMLDLPKPITRDRGVLAREVSKTMDEVLDLEANLHRASPAYSYSGALQRLIEGANHGMTEESAKILMIRGTNKISDNSYKFSRDPRLRSLGLNRYSHDDINELYRRIRCRVMFIKAKDWPDYERRKVIDEALQILKENCAEFQQVVVPGKHWVHLDNPEEVSGLINKFLS